MTTPISQTVLRVVVFSAFPVLVVFGLGFLVWPSIYLTAPVFYPYAPYSTNLSDYSPTIFHTDALGNWFFGGHSLLVGALGALFSRIRPWGAAWLTYGAYVVCAALLVHIGLHLLGFRYFMETP
jgi:hypothetical protein